MPEAVDSAISPEDIGTGPQGIAKRWHSEIKLAKKARKKWIDRSKKIVRRYRDERASEEERDYTSGAGCRFNILWSNVQTLLPAVYAKPPEPWVERRFLDRDPIGRAASMILERSLRVVIEEGYYHQSVRKAVLDYLLPGQGVVWLRYEPTYKDGPQITDTEAAEEVVAEEDAYNQTVASELVCTDYVHFEDYLTNPARTCDELRWIGKRAFLTRDQLVERFGKEIGKEVPLDHKPKDSQVDDKDTDDSMFRQAAVWEIWNKEDRKVYFIVENFGKPLEIADDPLGLECFWPTPEPLLTTTANDSIIPVPDYVEYQDQAQEIDSLTARIYALTKAIKAAGVCDASVPELQRLLEEGQENVLYPIENWSEFTQKGGMAKAVDMLPIKEMAETLLALNQARQQIKNDLYEITGISDMVRGFSGGPAKTATEQRIKGQYANMRLSDRQAAVATFARDAIRIIAEMVAEHFSPKTLFLMSGYGETDEFRANPEEGMAQFEKAIELLRNDKLRGFRVDIETDSTIEPDASEEKQSRMEFLTALSNFMPQALEAAKQEPAIGPLMGKTLLFGMRAFKVGRDLESSMEQAIAQLEQQAQQPKPPGPEEVEAQAEQSKQKMEMQRDAMDIQAKQQEMQMQQRAQALDMQAKEREHALKMEEIDRKAAYDAAAHEQKMQALQMQAQVQKEAVDEKKEAA